MNQFNITVCFTKDDNNKFVAGEEENHHPQILEPDGWDINEGDLGVLQGVVDINCKLS